MSLIPDAISVVIPTYNRAHLIKESIQSVLDQTLQPYEIIIVDDFSTDNTEEVINSFNSPLIKFIRNQRKKGANGARNTGILMAKGEYIAFHDSDDVCVNNRLELQYKRMKLDPSRDICFCSMKTKNRLGKKITIPSNYIKDVDIHRKIKNKSFISTQTIFLKTIKAREIMFDEDLPRLQDWDFILRSNGMNIHHINIVLVNQYLNNDSITKTVKSIDAYKMIFNKFPYLKKIGIYNKFASSQINYFENRGFINFLKYYYFLVIKFIIYILK